MEIPSHLTHKPIFIVDDYDKIDGCNPFGTDAMGLSLGLSTWSSDEISVKVWRHPKEKWSRQSEELPLHRALDLSILLMASSLMIDSNTKESISNLNETVRDNVKIENAKVFFNDNRALLIKRVEELKRVATLFLDKNT